MVSLANSLGALENPTKAQDKALHSLGLSSAGLTREMHKPDGLIEVLKTLADTAQKTGKPVGEIAAQIFGKGGAGTATVLINNIKDLSSAYNTLAGSNPKTLQSQFQQTMTQLGPQLQKAGANLNNALLNVGELILPGVSKVAGWVASFASAINSNKTLRDILGGTLFAGVVLSVAVKLKSAFDAVKSLFTGSQQSIQTGLLQQIATNTAAIAEEGGAGAVGGVGGVGRKFGAIPLVATTVAIDAAQLSFDKVQGINPNKQSDIYNLANKFGPSFFAGNILKAQVDIGKSIWRSLFSTGTNTPLPKVPLGGFQAFQNGGNSTKPRTKHTVNITHH